MAEFVLRVLDLDAGGKEITFPVRTAWVREVLAGSDLRADEKGPEGSFEMRADRTGRDILLTGRLRGSIVADCVRCLEDARIGVDTQVATLYSPAASGKHEKKKAETAEADVDPDEPDHEVFSGEEIVLDDLVRQSLILEVPMQPLCDEACEGIEIPEHVRPPADFGREEGAPDVDPRLAPLMKLAQKVKGGKKE